MAPGRRWRPVASNVSRAVGIARFSPMANIWPSLIATPAPNEAVSVTTVAPKMTRSAMEVVGFVISLDPLVAIVPRFPGPHDTPPLRRNGRRNLALGTHRRADLSLLLIRTSAEKAMRGLQPPEFYRAASARPR